jgi:hypothetical protein
MQEFVEGVKQSPPAMLHVVLHAVSRSILATLRSRAKPLSRQVQRPIGPELCARSAVERELAKVNVNVERLLTSIQGTDEKDLAVLECRSLLRFVAETVLFGGRGVSDVVATPRS